MPRAGRTLKKLGLGCLGLVVLLAILLSVTGTGKAVSDLWRHGIIQALLHGKSPDRKYDASEVGNLKAIFTALMMYHDSEGQFPRSDGWMDAIENRISASDMKQSEARKKLVRPSAGSEPNSFGYAMNDAASGKYNKDLDPKMPLIFDSSDARRNAHGDPSKLVPNPKGSGLNMGIAVDGSLLKL